MNADARERQRRAGRAASDRQKAEAYIARASARAAIMGLLSPGGEHRWSTIARTTCATTAVARAAINDLHEEGRVVLVKHGFWRAVDALPVSKASRVDPYALTSGEAHALAHLCEWLEVHQSVTVAALEGLSERLQADTGCNRREADALIEDWLRALIDKGRVEVNGPLIRIKANRAGAGLVLRLVEAGAASDELDDDEGD